MKNAINKTRVLQEIWRNKGISRIQISEKLGLNKSTITKITNDLLDNNLVVYYKKFDLENTAGRKRIGLTINQNYGVVIGIALETKYYRVVISDLYGHILDTSKDEIPQGDLLSYIKVIIDKTLEKTNAKGYKTIGIGIGIIGSVDPIKGILVRSNPLEIDSPLEIYKELSKTYNYPIFIDNDANCLCYGELVFEKAKRHNSFLAVLGDLRAVKRGNLREVLAIGLGVVVNGLVIHGDDFNTGEFRSLFWEKPNLSQFSEDSSTIDDKILTEFLKHIALFVNTFNFTKVIFTGVFTDYRDEIDKILRNEIMKNWLYDIQPEIEIGFSGFAQYSVAYGASSMVVEKFFTLPSPEKPATKGELRGIDLLLGNWDS